MVGTVESVPVVLSPFAPRKQRHFRGAKGDSPEPLGTARRMEFSAGFFSWRRRTVSTKRFLELVEEGLGIPEGSTTEEDRILDLEAWDSVGALSVIALLDEEFGVSLDAGALQSCDTLGELAGLVLKKAA